MLIQVLNDMADESRGGQDQSLLPHFADEAKDRLERQLKRAVAYDALTPQEKLDLARRLYG